MSADETSRPLVVLGTPILASDPTSLHRQKLARIALDSMVQFVGLLDASGTVLEINKVALDAVGIGLAEVEGKPFWTTFWWQVSEPVNRTLRESIARAAKGEFVRWDAEIFGRAGGSETIIIDASLAPVMDEDGNVVFICAEGRDITEKKAQEREIAQKNIELQGLLERIRELDEIKTQFFANVSHELRTPLTLILGPAQRLIDDEGQLGRQQRRESAEVITRSARMLLKHVNDLLDMSRLEAGKLKIELTDTDVAALVRFLASHFAVLAAERGIDYSVFAEQSSLVAVDVDKLQRVLMNLLANAFKFVPAGGRVHCTVQTTADELTLLVDDSGPGVPAAMRLAIFERFRQGDGGLDRKVSGTGLGLAIAKEFVEMHKGRIEVLDSPLGGARFQVSLPRHRVGPSAPEAMEGPRVDRTLLEGLLEELRPAVADRQEHVAEATRAQGEAAGQPGDRPRVLVVEDNPDMNRFVKQCLAGEYEVITAFDGREGLEQALRFRPALVVSDIMMPNVSGVEMIAEMRKLPALHDTPILLLSAKADEQLMVDLLDDGAQDFIVKPFSEKDLLVRVRNLMTTLRAREQAFAALAREQQAREQVDGLRLAAESANRAKDEFLAMLGHELRNPLSPIVTALQLMKGQGSSDSERARTVIERQVSHLTRLVDDLLDVSRIARGKVELKKEHVEIAEVVAKAIEMVSPLLEERSHVLTVEVSQQGLSVHGDPMRLGQVVTNLLTNAAKYTPPAGRIAVVAQRAGDELLLSVRDSGIGMSADVLPHVFDLFVQERQAIDRSQGGLGLGLAIVRNLVEGHGGSVSANSEGTGHGSELVVRLPLTTPVRASAHPQPAAAEAIPARARPVRVLVVDDNEDAASLLAEALERRGYLTSVAHDGQTALQLAAEFAPDVALLDIGLPVMDGYELAGRLCTLPGLAELRLIALTGYGQPSDRHKSRQAGFHQHLVKPVSMEALSDALRDI